MARNVHVSDLARRIGVSRTMIYRYFSGSVPRREVLRRITDFTGGEVTPVDFYASPPEEPGAVDARVHMASGPFGPAGRHAPDAARQPGETVLTGGTRLSS